MKSHVFQIINFKKDSVKLIKNMKKFRNEKNQFSIEEFIKKDHLIRIE